MGPNRKIGRSHPNVIARVGLLGLIVILGVAGCGKKADVEEKDAGPLLATAKRTHRFDAVTVEGHLPTGWSTDPLGRLVVREKAEGRDVVVMSIAFDAVGGKGTTPDELKAEMARKKHQALQVFAGHRPKIVTDLEETRLGVWTLATRVEESVFPGQWSYRVSAFHIPHSGSTMYLCEGNARLTKTAYWQALADICSGLTFTE